MKILVYLPVVAVGPITQYERQESDHNKACTAATSSCYLSQLNSQTLNMRLVLLTVYLSFFEQTECNRITILFSHACEINAADGS